MLLSRSDMYFLMWDCSLPRCVVDGAAVAEYVLELGYSFLVGLPAAQLFGLSLGTWQPEVEQLMQCFYVFLSCSESQDQEHVFTSGVS